MNRKYLLAVVLIAFTLTAIVGGFVIQKFQDWASQSPSEYPLQQAESLLQTVAANPGEPLHDGYTESCWTLLQEAMGRNDSQYVLDVAGVYGDNGTLIPGGTGSDVVLIEAVFPDGTVVELSYYVSTLNNCQELTDVQLPIE